MSVTSSPFSNARPRRTSGYTIDENGEVVYVRADGSIMPITVGGKRQPKPKTTFTQEVSTLDRELKQTVAAANSNVALDAIGRIAAAEDAARIAAGQAPKNTSSFGPLGVLAKKVLAVPAAAAKGALKVYDTVVSPFQQVGNSAVHEMTNAFSLLRGEKTINGEPVRVSWDDFIRQARTKDFKITGEGSQYASRDMPGWLKGGSQFILDTVFDPVTYATFGASVVTRAGRFALANRFATKSMLAKYPEMGTKLSNIARYGAVEIPKEIREAEGIFSGIRYFGKEVPFTSGIAKAWRYSLAPVRAGIGDVVQRSKLGGQVLTRTAPESIRPLVQSGFGRRAAQNTSNPEFIKGLFELDASAVAKGAESVALRTFLGDIAGDIEAVREIGIDQNEMSKIIRHIEGELDYTELSQVGQDLADSYKEWSVNTRAEVNRVRRKIADDYGVAVDEMGFVDDHIFHKLTDEAKDFMNSETGRRYGFSGKNLSAKDIIEGNGTTTFRKYRAPVRDENGKIIQQYEFMGEKIQRGTISEMNEIFRRKAGVDFDFFETDLGNIAQSYAESMARAVGRVRYVDRAFAYGSDVIMPILDQVIPDPDLVARLRAANGALLKQQGVLQKRLKRKATVGAAGTVRAVGQTADEVVDLARQVLNGRLMERSLNDQETAAALKAVDEVMQRIEEMRAVSLSKTREAKGEFDDLWVGLLNEAEAFRQALLRGDGERFMALKQLRQRHAEIYGDSVPATELDDKSAEWFAERILQDKGGLEAVSREAVPLLRRREYLRTQLDNLPASEETVGARKIIETELDDIELQLEGSNIIGDIKSQETYARDGVIWGSTEMPGDEVPFQMFTTKPVDDEFGTFSRMPDSIMGHAIPEDDLVDFRDAETMLTFLDADSVATYFDQAWTEIGVPDPLWRSVVEDAFATGRVDETFASISPAKSALLEEILDFRNSVMSRIDDETGELLDLTNGEVEQFFGWMRNINQHIVHEISPDNSDAVAGQVINLIYKQLAEDAAESGRRAALVPMSSLFPEMDDVQGHWSVLFPQDTPAPRVGTNYTDEWQFVEGNPLAESVYRGTEESYVLDLMNKGDKLKTDGLDLDLVDLTRKELEDELSKVVVDPTVEAVERARAAGTVTVNGKSVPAEVVRQNLAKTDRFFQNAYDRIEADIRRVVSGEYGSEEYLKGLRMTYDERLQYLFNQRAALDQWDNGVGVRLMQEIEDVVKVIQARPAKGSTAKSNAAWVKDVEKTMGSLDALNDLPEVRDAVEKLMTIVYADEAALAKIDDELADNVFQLTEAEAGRIGKVIAGQVEDGWEALRGMGVQMPEDLVARWAPNLARLREPDEGFALWKMFGSLNQYWKKTVTASVGFFVRNGMSATFMNYADGVPNEYILMGARWAAAQVETRSRRLDGVRFADWMARAGVDDVEEARQVMEIVAAAGRGVSDDFAIPSMGLSDAKGNPIKRAYNGYIGWFSRKNDFVENAVRIPMALDSVRRGETFSEAVARLRRVHFDYSDLSTLDATMKKFIPFWIWTSRNIPLQFAQIAFRPKAYYEYERIREDMPVNEELMLPKWISDIKPLGVGASTVLTPDLPHVRLAKSLQDISTVTGLVGQASPIIKVPVEVWLAKRQLGIDVGPFGEDKAVNGFVDKAVAGLLEEMTGSWATSRDPKTGQLLMDPRVIYTIEQFIPPLAQAFRLSGGRIGGKETLEERWRSSILTWLGIPLREVGEQQQRSEAIRRRYELGDFQKMLEQIALQGRD